ncbi:MAG: DUF2442 domain-containing protein [Pirellulales bacterium]
MSSSATNTNSSSPVAVDARITDDVLCVELSVGRSLSVPLLWFPRLFHASPAERSIWEWIGAGSGMHWPELDEDISIESLLAGRRSAESQESLK